MTTKREPRYHPAPNFIMAPVYPELLATSIASAASLHIVETGGFRNFLNDHLFSIPYTVIFCVLSATALYYRWTDSRRAFLFPRAIFYLGGMIPLIIIVQKRWLPLLLCLCWAIYFTTPRSMRPQRNSSELIEIGNQKKVREL